MFAELTSQEAIIGARAGMYRVSLLMVDHGKGLTAAHHRMIVKRLANP